MGETKTQTTHAVKTASFKNGVSLHRLLETAPLDTLEPFFRDIDDGGFARTFLMPPWPLQRDDSAVLQLRAVLLQTANSLATDTAVPLDRHAQRILTLADGRGAEALSRAAERLFESEKVVAFREQLDAVGRSVWLYQNDQLLFDEAESLFYVDHYRNFGRMYEAFELDARDDVRFAWDEAVRDALEAEIQKTLELNGRCSVTHLETYGKDQDGNERLQHLILVRHGGPLSSVAEFLEADGSRKERYYRPLNEATLLYVPSDGVLEIFSASPAVRQRVAASFAQVGLKMDLSDRPLTLKQYDLSRFLTSLSLSAPVIPGFDIERVAIVEVDCRPDNPKHRAGLKVTLADDIEVVAQTLFGQDHIFKKAVSLARVVIAVRYTQHGESKAKTLNITLSEPNRCNLRSNRDPVQRDLGYALLGAWGVLRQVTAMDAGQEKAHFPALMMLYDQTVADVPGNFFLARNLDPVALQEVGFVERKGRYPSLLIDEGGTSHEVFVRSAGKPGVVIYDHPVDGQKVELPGLAVEKFSVRRDWLDEIVVKRLAANLTVKSLTKLDDLLTYLGKISLNGSQVPCYLARDLRAPLTLQRLDVIFRSRSDQGVGIVLSGGRDHPLCLGSNVIVSVSDILSAGDGEALLDMPRLASIFEQRKQLAQGGLVVDLIRNDVYSATLYIPGKPSLPLTGVKQIDFFQALVDAYRSGSPAVPTKRLMDAAGSAAATPSQLFRPEVWKAIVGIYLGPPPLSKRGSFQLLV